ncbi:MAG: hypothetical protein JO368_02195, partial [Acidimicrobiales bacterium]|nr:hypothetical protein [Acidimicrobiales bacterium]
MRFPRPATTTRATGGWAVVVLVLLPVVAFGVPALAGHPTLPGDDLTQNFPLRVLAGEQIGNGHLPVFDAYLWSGSPLLAGWNAGAVYPLTLLFAVLPGTGAWTLNLIITWSVAGLSTYFLCRELRLAVLPSTLAALSFAFAGEMSSQIVHFGLITGIAWMPLAVLAVHRVAEPPTVGVRWLWTGVLAVAVGLVLLAGEPRAIDDALLVIAVFAAWTVLRLREGRSRAVLNIGAGLGIGVLTGALQWLPGAIAVSTSQRAASSAALFTSGSLPAKWLLLLLEPNLLGGTGSFGEPHFVGSYALLEVSGYIGIFPLVAAVALLARLRRGGGVPDWLVWHAVALLGLLLALGGSTPLWHVFAHVPLFGGQRLQSRNLLVVDFALALLFAYWADDVLSEPVLGRQPVGGDADTGWRRRARVAAAALPGAAVLAAVVALLWGAGLARWLTGSTGAVAGGIALGRWQLPFLVVDLAALGWVVYRDRLTATARATSLAVIVVADLATFTVLSVVAVSATPEAVPVLARTSVPPGGSATVRPIASLGFPGRFAIYNPDQLQEGDLAALGSPDLNVLTHTPGVQGYSAIVDGHYAATTGSHVALGNGQNTLEPETLDNGILDQLDDGLLVTLPQYLLTATAPGSRHRTGSTARPDRVVSSPVTWFFGTTLDVDRVSLPFRPPPPGSGPGTGLPRLGLAGGSGTTWLPTVAIGGRLVGSALRPTAATAVLLGTVAG